MATHAGGVAIITGAGGGLGTVVTPQFLDAGYRVCAVDIDEVALPHSDACMTLRSDFRNPDEARQVVKKTVGRFGRVDALVHLIGVWKPGDRLENTKDEFWDVMLDGNLRTAVNAMRAVIPSMVKQRSGRIIVTGATSALQPVVTWSAFGASVAALCETVRVAAAELRADGVTVNAILPSSIATAPVREKYGEQASAKFVDPRSIGSLLLWLCSDAGCDVSGALIPFIARQTHPCFEWHGVTDK